MAQSTKDILNKIYTVVTGNFTKKMGIHSVGNTEMVNVKAQDK